MSNEEDPREPETPRRIARREAEKAEKADEEARAIAIARAEEEKLAAMRMAAAEPASAAEPAAAAAAAPPLAPLHVRQARRLQELALRMRNPLQGLDDAELEEIFRLQYPNVAAQRNRNLAAVGPAVNMPHRLRHLLAMQNDPLQGLNDAEMQELFRLQYPNVADEHNRNLRPVAVAPLPENNPLMNIGNVFNRTRTNANNAERKRAIKNLRRTLRANGLTRGRNVVEPQEAVVEGPAVVGADDNIVGVVVENGGVLDHAGRWVGMVARNIQGAAPVVLDGLGRVVGVVFTGVTVTLQGIGDPLMRLKRQGQRSRRAKRAENARMKAETMRLKKIANIQAARNALEEATRQAKKAEADEIQAKANASKTKLAADEAQRRLDAQRKFTARTGKTPAQASKEAENATRAENAAEEARQAEIREKAATQHRKFLEGLRKKSSKEVNVQEQREKEAEKRRLQREEERLKKERAKAKPTFIQQLFGPSQARPPPPRARTPPRARSPSPPPRARSPPPPPRGRSPPRGPGFFNGLFSFTSAPPARQAPPRARAPPPRARKPAREPGFFNGFFTSTAPPPAPPRPPPGPPPENEAPPPPRARARPPPPESPPENEAPPPPAAKPSRKAKAKPAVRMRLRDTPLVGLLMQEHGLTRDQVKRRARQLGIDLENFAGYVYNHDGAMGGGNYTRRRNVVT